MPGMDVLDVLKRVKNNNPDIKVIVLTGHVSENGQKLYMKLGWFIYFQNQLILIISMKA
jgi:two-component system, OmpR family, response regulator CpxR